MPAYDRKAARKSRTYRKFRKYILRRLGISKRQRFRLYFSKAEGTIKAYTKIIEGYVKYMHRKEHADAYPITDTSLARYIDSLSTKKHRAKFPMIKSAVIFAKECRNERRITFRTSKLTLEGAMREAGARFRPLIKTNERIEYQETNPQMFVRQKFQTTIQ